MGNNKPSRAGVFEDDDEDVPIIVKEIEYVPSPEKKKKDKKKKDKKDKKDKKEKDKKKSKSRDHTPEKSSVQSDSDF